MASNADPESLPAFLQEGKVFSYQSLDAVIDSILQSKLELSERETQWLKQWYEDRKVPLDQLMARPALLDDLSARFAKTWDRAVAAERLLSEMLRLRKQGKWQPLRRKGSA